MRYALPCLIALTLLGAASPAAARSFRLDIHTCDRANAQTDDRVYVLWQAGGNEGIVELNNPGNDRERGQHDSYALDLPVSRFASLDSLTLRKYGNDGWCFDTATLSDPTDGADDVVWFYGGGQGTGSFSAHDGADVIWLDDQLADAPSSQVRFSDSVKRLGADQKTMWMWIHTCDHKHAGSKGRITFQAWHDGVMQVPSAPYTPSGGYTGNRWYKFAVDPDGAVGNPSHLLLENHSTDGLCIDQVWAGRQGDAATRLSNSTFWIDGDGSSATRHVSLTSLPRQARGTVRKGHLGLALHRQVWHGSGFNTDLSVMSINLRHRCAPRDTSGKLIDCGRYSRHTMQVHYNEHMDVPNTWRPGTVDPVAMKCVSHAMDSCGDDSFNEIYERYQEALSPARSACVADLVERQRADVVGFQEDYHYEVDLMEDALDAGEKPYTFRSAKYWDSTSKLITSPPGFSQSRKATYFARNSMAGRSDRFDFVAGGQQALSISGNPTYIRGMRWQRLRDRVTGREFYFVNAHLDHHAGQTQQAQDLVRILGGLANLPMIVVGDFNAGATSPAIATLQQFGLRHAFESCTDTGASCASSSPASDQCATFCDWEEDRSSPRQLDYIFYTPQHFEPSSRAVITERNSSCRTPGDGYSDHYPIWARLAWR